MKLTALVLLNLLVLASCTPTNTVEGETSSAKINAGAPYLWSSSAFPRNIYISKDFETDEVTNITSMGNAWESAVEGKKNFFMYTEDGKEVSSPSLDLEGLGRDNQNGIYKITHWPQSLPGSALAVTQIFGRRFNIGDADEYVRIEHADILINENLYDFRTSNSGSPGTYDLRTVVLHELGHFLGLNHKSGSTVMIPAIGSGTIATAPTNIDKGDIATKYNISLGTGVTNAILAGQTKEYKPNLGDAGSEVRILIELRADGECVHTENGAVIGRHSAEIK